MSTVKVLKVLGEEDQSEDSLGGCRSVLDRGEIPSEGEDEEEVKIDVEPAKLGDEPLLVRQSTLNLFPGLTSEDCEEDTASTPVVRKKSSTSKFSRKHSLMYPTSSSKASDTSSPALARGESSYEMEQGMDESIFEDDDDVVDKVKRKHSLMYPTPCTESDATSPTRVDPCSSFGMDNSPEHLTDKRKRRKATTVVCVDDDENGDDQFKRKKGKRRNNGQSKQQKEQVELDESEEENDDDEEVKKAGVPPKPPNVTRRESWKDPSMITGSWRVF